MISIGLAVGLYEKHNSSGEAPSTTNIDKTDYNDAEIPAKDLDENNNRPGNIPRIKPVSTLDFDISNIPPYLSDPYVEVNNNIPFFTCEDISESSKSFEYYSPLDDLGRCGMAIASVGIDLMPTEERGDIGMIKPSGWHTVRYDDLIDGNYLYNRCHLIGYQLCGENSNIENLITGTRNLNVIGMLPFEDIIANYVQGTHNHVLYRVTPIFEGENLLATGVLMEACSVEDEGAGIQFNVFCYNSQPGIFIDYSNGSSCIIADKNQQLPTYENQMPVRTTESTQANEQTYILNKNTKRFHYPWCSSVEQMAEKNRCETLESRDELISRGYKSCGKCNP
ncbi:MAG: DNA/RNA non-specific endonuclease [Prevotellaceae bacterium]|nr:DNA/RNA non-specific endonuclease [Prevotellaceae bacterium]